MIYGDWDYPQQFLLGTINQKIIFNRQSNARKEFLSLQSNNVSLSRWTHVVVTWFNLTRTVLMYADGKQIGNGTYTPGETFYGPTGKPYRIGNVDGRNDSRQFHGSVMDLYVFDTALSLDEINMLKGTSMRFLSPLTARCFQNIREGEGSFKFHGCIPSF